MLHTTLLNPFPPEIWPYLMTVQDIDVWFARRLVAGRSVSPAQLGDDFLQFFWLDPHSSGVPLIVARLASQSINHRKSAD